MPRIATLLGLVALLALLVSGCGEDSATDSGGSRAAEGPITLYNAQHEDLMAELVKGFTAETGIEVRVRNGSDLEMANQIVQEGDASPADVFATENSPAMTLVDSRTGFTPLEAATLEQVPARYRAPNRHWTGFAARATVLVHDKRAVRPSALPRSILDLASPEWKGRVGYSPTGADFQAIVSAVLALEGEAATKRWLAGLKANARAYQGNSTVMKAVNDGAVDTGIIYHYYWYQDQAEAGDNSDNTALHFFGDEDPGAFTSVSGAGVLASSDEPKAAQAFVRYLTSEAGQQILADSNALEYAVATGAASNRALKPLEEIEAPAVDVSALNSPKVTQMMQDAGIL